MVCVDAGVQARVVVLWRIARRRGGGDQFSGTRDTGLAGGAGEQPVVPDAMEPLWQDVEEGAPDELVGGGAHGAERRLPLAAIVLLTEGHGARAEAGAA